MKAEAGIPEADRVDGARHPRDTPVLLGQEPAEEAFLSAYRSGRFPHAWILGGPQGIGKATFAYRAARFVLTHPDPQSAAVQAASSLAIPPDAPAFRRMSAGAHTSLSVLRREWDADRKRLRTVITAEDARSAVGFFGVTAGEGGWRVCIVDSAEDLNVQAVNSLLKVIEEPPPRSLFLLVAHMPGRVLPTIRSRCRMQPFRLLGTDDVVRAVTAAALEPTDPAVVRRAAELSEGSARQAFRVMDEATLAVIEHIRAALAQLPAIDWTALHAVAEGVAGRANDAVFETVVDTLFSWLGEQVRGLAPQGSGRLAPLAEVWDKIARSVRETEAYNLDRRALVLTLFAELSEALRAARAA